MQVLDNLSFPYYPPRPKAGVTLRAVSDRDCSRYHISPKLNGDRGNLVVIDGDVHISNRHGSLYQFNVKNRKDFLKLPSHTVVDGEIWKGVFYPFEAVAVGGDSLMRQCPSVRAAQARELCRLVGVDWLFETPNKKWYSSVKLPAWEGVVKKRLGSPYVPLASATQSSTSWFKNKW